MMRCSIVQIIHKKGRTTTSWVWQNNGQTKGVIRSMPTATMKNDGMTATPTVENQNDSSQTYSIWTFPG